MASSVRGLHFLSTWRRPSPCIKSCMFLLARVNEGSHERINQHASKRTRNLTAVFPLARVARVGMPAARYDIIPHFLSFHDIISHESKLYSFSYPDINRTHPLFILRFLFLLSHRIQLKDTAQNESIVQPTSSSTPGCRN